MEPKDNIEKKQILHSLWPAVGQQTPKKIRHRGLLKLVFTSGSYTTLHQSKTPVGLCRGLTHTETFSGVPAFITLVSVTVLPSDNYFARRI